MAFSNSSRAPGVWEDNNQGQITSFYSEGIITGWGNPQKEKLVQIEFSYRDDGTSVLWQAGKI